MSIWRSVPIRFRSSICRSSSSRGFSNSSVYAEGIGSTCLDVVNGVGTQEIAQGPDEVVFRRDADATGAEAHVFAVPVAPLNIERRRARVRRAEHGRRPKRIGRGRRRRAPAEAQRDGTRGLQLLETAGRFHDERSMVLTAIAVAVPSGQEQGGVRKNRRVELGPRVGEHDRLGGTVKVLENKTGVFLPGLL